MCRTWLRSIATLLLGAGWAISHATARGDELPIEYGHGPAPAYQRHGPGFGYQPLVVDPPVSTSLPEPAQAQGDAAGGSVMPVPVMPVPVVPVPVVPAPAWSRGGWFQRPYPYHFDYYRQRYGGAPAPPAGNIYLPPAAYPPGYFVPPSLPYGYRGGYRW